MVLHFRNIINVYFVGECFSPAAFRPFHLSTVIAAPIFALRPDLKPMLSRTPTAGKTPAEKLGFYFLETTDEIR